MQNNPFQTGTLSDYVWGIFWFILAVIFVLCMGCASPTNKDVIDTFIKGG